MPIDRGCVFTKDVQFKNKTDGQPVPITTWQFEASLKNEAGEEQLPMSTSGGHFTVFDGPKGWLRISMTEAETEALDAGPISAVLYRTDGGRKRYATFSDIVRDPE